MAPLFHALLVLCVSTSVFGMWVKEMENAGAFEGDMILDPDEFERGWNTSKEGRGMQTYASIKGGRWPGAVVPYQVEGSVPGAIRVINQAIAEYHKYTCIRFIRRTNQPTYVSFYRGGGCSSPVGYRYRRVNRISLATGCWYKGIVMHELGHTLGFYHEQSRPDRDKYVQILWSNIYRQNSYNFNKQPNRNIDSLGTPYDFSSMMHYGSSAFGINRRQTIRTIDPSKQRFIGQRYGFSSIDVKQLNLMYCKGGTGGSGSGSGSGSGGGSGGGGGGGSSCVDKTTGCGYWVRRNYCSRNSRYYNYMRVNCRKSCRHC